MRANQQPRYSAVALATLALWICLAGPSSAQDTGFVAAENPYQHDYGYEIGDDLQPRVDVDGVQWSRLSIRPKSDREYPASKPVPVLVEVDLRNTSDAADVLIIVLFEDGQGHALDRLELSTIFIGRDRPKEAVQKHKVRAPVLEATRNIYVFFEVSR